MTNAGSSAEPDRWSSTTTTTTTEGQDSMTRTLRHSEKVRNQDSQLQYVRSEHAKHDAEKRADVPDQLQSGNSSPHAGNCQTKPAEHHTSSHDGVPFMSPMPVPVSEEPLSDCGSAEEQGIRRRWRVVRCERACSADSHHREISISAYLTLSSSLRTKFWLARESWLKGSAMDRIGGVSSKLFIHC